MSLPEHTIIRSSRRTFSLEITPDAKLLVRAPRWALSSTIENILRERESWIQSRLQKVSVHLQHAPQKTLISGDTIFFLGERISVFFIAGKQKPFHEKGMLFVGEIGDSKMLIEDWYRKQMKTLLPEKIAGYAQAIGKSPSSFRVTGAEKRWGSCSSTGNLNFSWRLCMAPEWVIDYVVAHETAHLLEMNHSSRFWKHVEHLFPCFREAKHWLKEHGFLLQW